jgi:hypothetical protein
VLDVCELCEVREVLEVCEVLEVWQMSQVRFTSTQLNCAFLFLIFIFPRSPYHVSYFIFHISKNAAHMNSMHSVRMMFHRTEGVSSEPDIFELDECW